MPTMRFAATTTSNAAASRDVVADRSLPWRSGFWSVRKWYGVMGFGVSFIVLIAFVAAARISSAPPRIGVIRADFDSTVRLRRSFLSTTVYALAWVPDLVRHSPDPNEIHNLNEVVYRQYTMFEYHDTS